MRVSVVLATYNQPDALAKTLAGYRIQEHAAFQVVIADDGSGPETAQVILRFREEMGADLLHVRHEDRGFRKCEILNRAILAADGDYLIFSDGDCIPAPHFVATHARLAERGRFLSGGYLKLPACVGDRIGEADVLAGRATDPTWLRRQGWRPGRHALRLGRSRRLAAVLDRLTPTRASWNGHNASTWRDALLAVNGFDAEMGYGGLDRALGERLENAGVRGRQIRFRAPCVHLEHGRPYRDPERVRRNREIRARIRRDGETRARVGIEQLQSEGAL